MQYDDENMVRKLYEKLDSREVSYLLWSKIQVLLSGIMVGYILGMIVNSK